MTNTPVHIGISACLLGNNVRYDGGHKRSHLCQDVLAATTYFISFCPEVAAGFSTPRPAMRLTGNAASPSLIRIKDSTEDLRPRLEAGFEERLANHTEMNKLDGYILMQKSPSCGVHRVKLYNESGQMAATTSMGIFAQALKTAYPLLPIEEEGRLRNAQLFDNFMMRVYAYQRFKDAMQSQAELAQLTIFHSRYKYLLMAHNQQQARALGQLLGNTKTLPLPTVQKGYLQQFMQCLAVPASRKNHCNALQHMLGHLKNELGPNARQLLANAIEQFRLKQQPLHTPLTLLKHYAEQNPASYLGQQYYFSPYPLQLNPFNHPGIFNSCIN